MLKKKFKMLINLYINVKDIIFNLYIKINLKYSIYYSLFLVALLLLLLYKKYPISVSRIATVQNSLITVSGIISGVMIAYLSGKIFSISAARSIAKVDLDKFSVKLTAFRRLIYFVYKSRNFWIKYDNIQNFKKNYPTLDYYIFNDQMSDNKEKKLFFQDVSVNKYSINSIHLYLAMEAIYKPDTKRLFPAILNDAVHLNYSMDEIDSYMDASNTIWYYLEGRYEKHGKGLFDDQHIDRTLWEDAINSCIEKIDITKKDSPLDRELLAEFGSKFYGETLPKYYTLTSNNTGIPKRTISMTNCLVVILLFGVIVPLLYQGVGNETRLFADLTSISVSITILAILYFIFDFYQLLEEETDMFRSHN